MDEQVIDDLYNRAKSKGYPKSKDEFIQLLHTDNEVLDDSYSYVKSKGYPKPFDDFKTLIGVGSVEAPEDLKKKVSMASSTEATPLDSQSTQEPNATPLDQTLQDQGSDIEGESIQPPTAQNTSNTYQPATTEEQAKASMPTIQGTQQAPPSPTIQGSPGLTAPLPQDQKLLSKSTEDDLSNLGSNALSGIKRAGFQLGKATEDQAIHISEGMKKVSDNPAWIDFWDEQANVSKKNIKGLESWNKTIEEPKGGAISKFMGDIIPLLGLSAATVLTRSPTAAQATSVLFGQMMYGSGIDAYDKNLEEQQKIYEQKVADGDTEAKPPEVDDATRAGVGILYGVLGALPVGSALGGVMKKTVFQKTLQTVLEKDPEAVAAVGKDVFEKFAKDSPTLAKRILSNAWKGSGNSIANMVVMEDGQKAVDDLMIKGKNDPEGKSIGSILYDYAETAGHAVAMGIFFHSALAPFATKAELSATKERRDKQGGVTLGYNKEKDQAFEIVTDKDGTKIGITPTGEQIKLSQSDIDNSFSISNKVFEKGLKEYEQTNVIDKDIYREDHKEKLKTFIDMVSVDDNVYPTKDKQGNSLYGLREDDNGNVLVFDPKLGTTYAVRGEDVPDWNRKPVPAVDFYRGFLDRYDIENQIPIYKINNERVTEQTVQRTIEDTPPEDLAKLNFNFGEYDPLKLQDQVQNKIVKGSIKDQTRQANPSLNEPSLDAITDLEVELRKLQGNDTQVGKDKTAELRQQIKDIQLNPLKETKNAVQKPSTDESLLRTSEPKMELQGVGKGNAQPKGPSTGTQETITTEKPQEVNPQEKPTKTQAETAPVEAFFNDADKMFPNDHILGGYAVTNPNGELIGRINLSEVDNNTVKIDEVVSEKRGQKTGNGSLIMKMITNNADKNNVKLTLTPNIIGDMKAKGFETPQKLQAFYAKFGFVKDKGKYTMTRLPKTTSEVAVENNEQLPKTEVVPKPVEVNQPTATEAPKEAADVVHNDLLAHLGIKEAPVGDVKPVKKYTAKNIDTISQEGLTDTQKKVVSDVKNVVKSVSKLVEKTSGTPLEVNVHEDPLSYEKAVLDAGGTKQESTSKGFYLASDGTIHLNMDRVTSETMLHEGFHPVLDYMAENRPDIINKLHDQLKGLVGGKDIIKSAEENYKGDNETTIKKEAITDYIAKVADGTIKIDKTNFQKVKDFVVNAVNKLGFDIGRDINTISDLKKLAQVISEKFNKGEEIGVSTKENLNKNTPQFQRGDKLTVEEQDYKSASKILKEDREKFKKNPEAVTPEPQLDKSGKIKLDVVEGNNGERNISIVYKTVPYDLEKGSLKYVSKEKSKAIDILSDKLVSDYKTNKDKPEISAAIDWYGNMRQWFQKNFGANIESFGQLLAATSARTEVVDNFKQAVEAMRNLAKGKYDNLLKDYDSHVKKIKSLSNQELRERWQDKNPSKKLSLFDANDYRRFLINQYEGIPLRSNGKKFNANSKKVLQALYGNWIEQTEGPKTKNFAGNLTGRSFNATIDVWAARYLRRKIFEGKTKEWRILPQSETGVQFGKTKVGEMTGDYPFAEQVMGKAADKLGIKADDLQAFLWYLEKDVWDKNNWTNTTGKKKASFEDTASSISSDRYQVGATTFKNEDTFNQIEFEKERKSIEKEIGDIPGVMASRVNASEGEFISTTGTFTEPTYDIEFTVEKGSDISSVIKKVHEIQEKYNQDATIISKFVNKDHENARPIIEIGLATPAEKSEIINDIKKTLSDLDVRGFTIARDKQGKILGVISQFIPEFEKNIGIDKGIERFAKAFEKIKEKYGNDKEISYLSTDFVDSIIKLKEDGKTENEQNGRVSNAEQGIQGELSKPSTGKKQDYSNLSEKQGRQDQGLGYREGDGVVPKSEIKPQFSKECQDSKIRDFIEAQRGKGVSESDIKLGLEKASQQIGLDKAKINELMSSIKETPVVKEEIKAPKEGTRINKETLEERGFVGSFGEKSDQSVAENTARNLEDSASRSGRNVQDQAAYEVKNMRIHNGEASEHQIVTAAFHLHNLDAQIKKANQAGEDASFLITERQDAFAVLKQLGENAGRNLRLFGQAYKVTEEGRIEIIKASLRKDLGVDKIPNSVALLDASEMNPKIKEKLRPYVEEIQNAQKELNRINVETERDTKAATQTAIKDVASEVDKPSTTISKGAKLSADIFKKSSSILRDIANKLRNPSKGAQFSKSEQGKNIDVQGNTADAILYVVNKMESGHIPDLIEAASTKFSGEGLSEKELKSKLHDVLASSGIPKDFLEAKTSKDAAIEDLKALVKIEGVNTLTKNIVSKGIVRDIFNDYARKGVPYEELVAKTTEDIKKSLPNVTEDIVSDAILNRGEFKRSTKAKVKSDIEIATQDVRRLANTQAKIKSLQVVQDVNNIKNDRMLSANEKKSAIQERKSEYEKDLDERLSELKKEKSTARILEEIEHVRKEKTIYEKALKNPKKVNDALEEAKAILKNEYTKTGVRRESGSKTEINIVKSAEAQIKEIEDSNYSAEVKKEHIKAIKDLAAEQIKNTKQGVLTNLKDAIDSHLNELTDKAKEAYDNGLPIDKISDLKDELRYQLMNKLKANEENLKDQIDKADQKLQSIIDKNKGTEFEKDLKDLQKEFRRDWQRTSNELQAKELVANARRSVREAERRMNAGQFSEIPMTKLDASMDAILAREEALKKKAWSKLSSMSQEAKDKSTSNLTSKVLEARRDIMIASFSAIEKIFASGLTKPILDPLLKQTFGRLSALATGIRPTEFKRLGLTFKQLKNEESAKNFMDKVNKNYENSIANYENAKGTKGEEAALKKMRQAEIDHNASLAYLFINAGSHIDIAQVMVKGATDFDASMGKYKQSFPEQRSTIEGMKFWLQGINRTHAAVKSISHRQALMDHYIENLQHFQDKDGNITPESRMMAWDTAALMSEEGRFGERTMLSDQIAKWKNSENAAVRNAANYAFPVAKIGINIAKQGLDMAFGLVATGYKVGKLGKMGMEKNVLAGKEYSNAYSKFTDGVKTSFNDLPLEQKKRINTLLTRGLFGLAQYAIVGYMLSNGQMKYGGSYDENDPFRHNKVMGDDGTPLDYGQWEINGYRTPKLLSVAINHSPYLLPSALASMLVQQLNNSKAKEATIAKAIGKVTNEVYEKLPVTGAVNIAKAAMGDEYRLERIIANEVPTTKNLAEFLDTENGEVVKRDVKGEDFLSTIKNIVKSNIPGSNYRESLPVKKVEEPKGREPAKSNNKSSFNSVKGGGGFNKVKKGGSFNQGKKSVW